ncbi:interleukin-34 isoform X1 [Alligator mississippiensis]|uniref:interleukin-34 isoform X1 n=2 Tax=Alligator mississippiensis TaxID=8496 RepID=UPI0009073824|nr:interleukin-34 isoform X1 [Alligator mississippiensis]XP_059569634.1 interleukin-34 isoform X1 [Alligator mississippiensis]
MRPLCTSLIYVLAVLGLEAVMQKECEIVGILQDKLKYKERLQYMKYYFPLNYTVTVQYEEVLRTSNVSRLRDEAITEPSLRYLWFHVSSQVVLKIRDVLPEQHPSWSYTQELCDLLEGLGAEYEKYKQEFYQLSEPQQLAFPPPSTELTTQGLGPKESWGCGSLMTGCYFCFNCGGSLSTAESDCSVHNYFFTSCSRQDLWDWAEELHYSGYGGIWI